MFGKSICKFELKHKNVLQYESKVKEIIKKSKYNDQKLQLTLKFCLFQKNKAQFKLLKQFGSKTKINILLVK